MTIIQFKVISVLVPLFSALCFCYALLVYNKIILGFSIKDFRKAVNKKLYLKQCICVHTWTSQAMEDKPPTAEQLKSIEGFFDYAKLYCKKCKYESDLNKRW